MALPPRPCEGLWHVGDPVSSCVTEAPEVTEGPWLRDAAVGQTQSPAFGARMNLILSPSYFTPKMRRHFLAQGISFPD